MSKIAAHRKGEDWLCAIGKALNESCPKGSCYVLQIYTVGQEGFAAYVSNGERASMIEALRETADRLEAGTDSDLGADVE